MTVAMRTSKGWFAGLVVAAALGSGEAAQGQEMRPRAAQPAPEIPLSERLAELVPTCLACHGEDGVPNYAESPIVDGQNEGYLFVQLRDYKNGARKHEAMNEIVKDLSRQDLRELAAYFAARPWPRVDQPPPEDGSIDVERLLAEGQCRECHGADFLGDGTMPRLAGQLTSYLASTMRAFKLKERTNNAAMGSLLDTFSDEEIEAIARYLGAL
ncbi:MAG: c-type cytochrome [Geminicoccaceae bacterium]|nr:c-type cytochrome [Geminicoccaceae bacterium]MCS7266476.1 c-type cytochrome [Geminicoccaceae bacterium]MCX7629395.1 c-type cytochrome [Geminicoccaceae bacterium]MDW8123928.1 c-type cytochrome [Geminicoccaceae bacterium]MDW8340009.1 c-type cytochrome [Geminicoccaceae bacterium]